MSEIIGYFASLTLPPDSDIEEDEKYEAQFADFRKYVWGDTGLKSKLQLDSKLYGKDLSLILLQFDVYLGSNQILREIHENYRPKEKAIGVHIVVNSENFFDHSEADRQSFLKQTVISALQQVQKQLAGKLDTNFEQLITDVSSQLD